MGRVLFNSRISFPWNGRSPLSHPTCEVSFPPRRPGEALQSCKALALWHCNRYTSFRCTADSTFCIKLVAELLRDGGVVPADVLADGVCISPSTLYRVLTRSTHVLLPQRQPCVSAPIVPLHFSQLNGPQELRVHSRGVTR